MPETYAAPVGEVARSRRPPLQGIRTVVVVAVLIAGLGLGLAAGYVILRAHQHRQDQLLRPAGIPATVSTPLADLMRLSPVPASVAPGFTLVDQNGQTMALTGLRRRAVVLEFMDPHCTDICPIVSQEFVDAYRDLGTKASRVVFAAVNINQYHLQVADVAAFSREQQLTSIPSWHFFTGSFEGLRQVWQEYGVTVDAPGPNADVIHSSVVYFIDPQGRERYVATPMVDHTSAGFSYLPGDQLAAWGRGIALVARQLLSQQASHRS
jgi:cytochrome oxidase Cu insertion factor (SCO1/SenC/PrrC family)